MKILALEFSTSQRSVAAVQPLTGTAPAFQSEIVEVGGRSTRAFALIEQALSEARINREEIECIAVGLGPGSYTGIRVAIALAQGWQLAREVRLLGLNTVECLAHQAHAEGRRGLVSIVVDAQRGEFYHSGWELAESGAGKREPLRIVTRDDIEQRLASGEAVLGPDLTKPFPSAVALFPSARVLGRLALERTDFLAGEQLQPVYLRETTFVKAPPPRTID